VEERAGDLASPAAGFAQWRVLRVGEFNQRRIVPRFDQTRIVEFVSAQDAGRVADGTVS
jgi:hypothetical protein